MKAYNRNSDKPGLKHFKLLPLFPHLRSEGRARRSNRGTPLQPQHKETFFGRPVCDAPSALELDEQSRPLLSCDSPVRRSLETGTPVMLFASSEPTSHGYIYQDF